MTFQSVCIIGLGYIGLPTAAIVASRGVKVLGVDVVQATVDATNIGQIRIVEHELGPLVRSVVESGHLRAATKPEPADVFIIAVPTPFKGDYQPDISFVLDAARSICTALARGNLVILESTSPVGTTEHIEQLIAEVRPDLVIIEDGKKSLGVAVAYCPERVLPGKVIYEVVHNDRIIGGMTPA